MVEKRGDEWREEEEEGGEEVGGGLDFVSFVDYVDDLGRVGVVRWVW